MSVVNRIVYSGEQMKMVVDKALDRMSIFRYDKSYNALLGDTFLNKIEYWGNIISKYKNDAFTVVVIGDFKRGKSTFINALLGESVVPVNVTPETVTMNKISYGLPENEAVLNGAKRIRLADDELTRSRIKEIIEDVGEPISNLEIKRPYEFLKNISIIDTPGMNDALDDFTDMIKEAILQADAVIYVYNVLYPLSSTEQIFLKSAVIPQKYTSLFIVGNYTDALETEENYFKQLQVVQKRVKGLLPEADIIMLSALDELCVRLGKKRPCEEMKDILSEGFDAFRDKLVDLVELKKDSVVADRIHRLTFGMIEDLRIELNAIDAGLKMSREESKKALENFQQNKQESIEKQSELIEDIDKLIDNMKKEALAWMTEFLHRIEKDSIDYAESSENSEIKTDELRKYYELYCIDMLQNAMNTCIEYHREQLYDKLQSISDNLAKKIAGSFIGDGNYDFRMSIDNKIWTKGDTVGMYVSLVSSFGFIGSVASLVVDGFTGAMREKEKQRMSGSIIKQIAGKLTGLTMSMTDAVNNLYADLSRKAHKIAFGFYEDELNEAERLLKSSVNAANIEDEKKAQISDAVKQARLILDECEAGLL